MRSCRAENFLSRAFVASAILPVGATFQGVVIVFRRGTIFKLGWLYFVAMFILAAVLPPWMGVENGVIENLQLVCLAAGGVFCWRMRSAEVADWGGSNKSLWAAGTVLFFLGFMREISWGRVFFISEATGEMVKSSEMGIYGTAIHALVGLFIVLALYLLYSARVWRMLFLVKLPVFSLVLMFLFVALGPLGELIERGKIDITFLHGQILEELAELGAYIVAFKIAKETGNILKKLKK